LTLLQQKRSFPRSQGRIGVAAFASKFAALTALAALVAAPLPAEAQFGGILGSGKRGADKADACGKGKKGDKGRGIVGGLLGGAVDQLARSANLPSFVPVPEFSDQITESIACKLDPEEQKQAAEATLAVTRTDDSADAPEVGASAAWTSNSRENVSGTSTVTSRQGASGGTDCITVTDVVIVEGEETRAEKRMCRAPGSARYSIIA
jgi:surface antigen